MESKEKVVLILYDITAGMARQFSQALIGKFIEAIWHTSVVVFGKEYQYQGGIQSGVPKQTITSIPIIRELDMGFTELSQQDFEDFLKEINNKFSYENYNILTNNCNNFTDACVEFLTGNHIPEYITGLPNEILSTPLGAMFRPMIEQFENQMKSSQQPLLIQPNQNLNANQPLFGQQQPLFGQQQQPQFGQQQQPLFGQPQYQQKPVNQNVHIDMKKVQELHDLEEFFSATDGVKACIIDFYMIQCGPCQMIKPIYAAYSEEFPEIKFFSIDGVKNQEICQQFNITGFPTFAIFVDGQFKEKFSGANQINLKNKLDSLKETLKQKENK